MITIDTAAVILLDDEFVKIILDFCAIVAVRQALLVKYMKTLKRNNWKISTELENALNPRFLNSPNVQ